MSVVMDWVRFGAQEPNAAWGRSSCGGPFSKLEPTPGKPNPEAAVERGDVNLSRAIDISDAVLILNFLFHNADLYCPGAGEVNDYDVRIFAFTYVEPVLRQLIHLEQAYETDETVIAVAAKKAKLWQAYGMSEVSDEVIAQELSIKVNVGIGATDPTQRLGRFMMAGEALQKLLGPTIAMDINKQEVAEE